MMLFPAAPGAEDARALRAAPLSQLRLSPLNPRREVAEAEIAALAQSIRAVGLLQNLAGVEAEDGAIAIVAGGRRLRALERIAAEDGLDPAAVMVPVRLAENAAEAAAWAVTENEARAALNPADEVSAYARMVETGSTVETIARAFAVTVRHVKGRLRLAGLAPCLLDALRAGEITLDVAAAYTVTDDHAAQEAAFRRLSGGWNADNPAAIRRALTAGLDGPDNRLARFIGRDAYEAAGGAVREDLFGEEVWFLDAGLLRRLADEKLGAAAEALAAEGWAWVESRDERLPWEEASRFGRVYPVQQDIDEAEAARFDDLAEMVEAGTCDEAERAELAVLSAKLDAETWTADQLAHAGAILWIDPQGSIGVARGMVRPDDRAAAAKAGLLPEPESRTRPAPERKGPYPAALLQDLAAIRTGAIQTALLRKPELALDLLTFALSLELSGSAAPLGLTTCEAVNAPADDPGMALPERLRPAAPTRIRDAAEAAERFAVFRARPKKTRTAMLTERIARLFTAAPTTEATNPLVEAVAALAGAQVREVWTPTAAFLRRLTGAQLDAIMAEIHGRETPRSFVTLKKADKVARLHALFNTEQDRRGMAQDALARLAAWTPAMAGPAVTVAESEDEEN